VCVCVCTLIVDFMFQLDAIAYTLEGNNKLYIENNEK